MKNNPNQLDLFMHNEGGESPHAANFEFSCFDKMEPPEGGIVNTPEDMAKALKELSEYSQECFTVICLNTRNQIIKKVIVSVGLVDSCAVHPREIFKPAIKNNSKSIILAHNHPSGDPSPSSQDIKITRKMVDAGELLDIPVRDHIIIGDPKRLLPFCSIREQGLIRFD